MEHHGGGKVVCRAERPGEEAAVRAAVADAFVDEPVVADLVDALRASPDWVEGLSFVAEREGDLVAHILFTRALLDAPRRLVEVLTLGPVGWLAPISGGASARPCCATVWRESESDPSRLSSWKATPPTTPGSVSSPGARSASGAGRCASRSRPSRCSGSRRTSPG